MATVHISESEAASDFAGLMARVREGTEVIIESDQDPRSVVLTARPKDGSISATLARLKTISDERGHELFMDDDFAADMEEIIQKRKPREVHGDY
jgi:antitoxin (DNA-binding transcriptional repressor) of toxin-antitoxin stability system